MVSRDWVIVPLGKVVTLQRGYDLPNRLRRPGEVPIITSSGIGGTHSEAMVSGPGVVTGRYGTIGEVFYIESEFWPLNTTLFVRDFHGNDPLFVSYLLRTIDFQIHSGKSGVPGVNRNDLREVVVALPPTKAEQEAIAEALSDVDALIESLEQLIAKKRQIKQGAMQELLTGKKRLPGFATKPGYKQTEMGVIPEDWGVCRLSEGIKLLSGYHVLAQYCNADGHGVPYVTLADLDATVLWRFREQAVVSRRLSPAIFRESDAQLLDKLRLIAGRYLKRAAVLLFHPDPERFVTGAFIKIGYFRTNSELLFHDEIHGDLFSQIDKTMDLLLTKYLKAMISYEGVQRVETYPVPEEALREALHNAVAHKDYSSGVPIQISVYEDKILFWNNGELYEGWTVNTLVQKHSSQPFNPDVAHTFFRAGMIEAWGRGIEHMIDACKAADVPVPLLRYETPGLWVEFPMRVAQRPDKIRVGTTPEAIPKTTQKIPQKILAILVENPSASRREIAERLADITEDGVKYHLDRLKAAGKIRRIGPARGGHWEVQDDARE